jgi:hypothetical protein
LIITVTEVEHLLHHPKVSYQLALADESSTVGEHLPHHSKFKGFSPALWGTLKEKMVKNIGVIKWLWLAEVVQL